MIGNLHPNIFLPLCYWKKWFGRVANTHVWPTSSQALKAWASWFRWGKWVPLRMTAIDELTACFIEKPLGGSDESLLPGGVRWLMTHDFLWQSCLTTNEGFLMMKSEHGGRVPLLIACHVDSAYESLVAVRLALTIFAEVCLWNITGPLELKS